MSQKLLPFNKNKFTATGGINLEEDIKISANEMKEIRQRLTQLIKQDAGNKFQLGKKVGASSGNVDAWFKSDSASLPGFKALRNMEALFPFVRAIVKRREYYGIK